MYISSRKRDYCQHCLTTGTHTKHENARTGYATPSYSEDPFQASTIPAHQGRNDDTPCRTAAVSIQMFFTLPMAATQPKGVEQEKEQVQSEAGERDATQ